MKLCFRRRVMAPDGCHWPLTTKAGVRFQFGPCEICGKQVALGQIFLEYFVFSCQYHANNAPHWSSSTRCSLQSDKRAKPGNLPKNNVLRKSRSTGQKGNFLFFPCFKKLKIIARYSWYAWVTMQCNCTQ